MDIDEVLQVSLESNPSTSTRELARECGVSKDTVSRHLLSMGKVKKRSRLVSHELSPQQSAITSRRTKEKFKELHTLPDPPYSPNLAPSDYHWFRSMAHFFHGKKFDNLVEVEIAIQEFFDRHSKEWYQRGIEQLASGSLMTVDNNGL
ncbi:histone-lysine N-methyltransferase SETMAR-like [Halyomorpha halys]|uniref:histone-lysine N-methyltransferase SETMAR-like n=1 Tax=Halyomorpha halys TaxID=286706 RepID=UPI0034D34D3C